MFSFARLPLIFRSSSSKALAYTSERKHGLSYFDTLSSFSYTSERTFDSFYVVCTHPCFCLECSDCSIWSRLHFAFSQMSPSFPRRSPPDFPLLPSVQDFASFRQRPGYFEETQSNYVITSFNCCNIPLPRSTYSIALPPPLPLPKALESANKIGPKIIKARHILPSRVLLANAGSCNG